MSGADLEYAAMLARAGIDPTSAAQRKHMDAARLEQINDTDGFGTAVERAKSQIRAELNGYVAEEVGTYKGAASGLAPLDATQRLPEANVTYRLTESNLSDSYGGRFLVTDAAYGATGDGITDDTSAIQAAINAASVTGGEVYFPHGTYLIGSTLTLKTKVHLRGAGPGATILKLATGVNVDMFKGDGFDALTGTTSTAGIYQWSIESMTLDGSASGNPTAGTGIKVFGYDFRLSDLRIKSFRTNGIYAEYHMNATPTTGFSMEATLTDINITNCGDEGIVWAGPHDSHWHAVVVWQCNANGVNGRGVHVKPQGNALNAINCHVWGGQHPVAWYLEAPTTLTDCQGEGATTAQVIFAGSDCRIMGGHYFAAGAASTKGVVIGDATHTGITGSVIDTKVSNCTSGAIDFTYSGGSEIVRMLAYQTTGSARVGSPSFLGSLVQLHVVGGATGAIFIASGATSYRNGGTSAASWADTGTTRFNVDVANKLFQGVNGGGFIAYSDAFSTQKWKVDGATGVMTMGTSATLRAGTGTPEGVVVASVGSVFMRTDGGANTTLYVKESGTGATGWIAK